MLFQEMQESAERNRELYNTLFEQLPRVEFQPNWLDSQGEPKPAVTSAHIWSPECARTSVTAIDPVTTKRYMLIPTKQFGTIVFYDLWENRRGFSPVGAAHPEGFDQIGLPFALLAKTPEEVAEKYVRDGVVVVSDALSPIFDTILQDLRMALSAGHRSDYILFE